MVGPNQPQTLTGIETDMVSTPAPRDSGPINLKPLQGLKQWLHLTPRYLGSWRPNQPQTLTGIETKYFDSRFYRLRGPNQPQTLTGIETRIVAAAETPIYRPNQPQTLTGIETALPAPTGQLCAGPINLKPLQGLKRTSALSSFA